METRNRADVSIAAADDRDANAGQPGRRATERPGSAPVTRDEGAAARLSAGSAGNAVAAKPRESARISKPRIVEQIERELDEMRRQEVAKRGATSASGDLDFDSRVT